MKRSEKVEAVRHDPWCGWGMVVGGPVPYVSSHFFPNGHGPGKEKAEAVCTERYHKAVEVVLLTKADYRKLLRAARQRKR